MHELGEPYMLRLRAVNTQLKDYIDDDLLINLNKQCRIC